MPKHGRGWGKPSRGRNALRAQALVGPTPRALPLRPAEANSRALPAVPEGASAPELIVVLFTNAFRCATGIGKGWFRELGLAEGSPVSDLSPRW